MNHVAIIPGRSPRNILWAIAQRNGFMWHNRHALLNKHEFLSNTCFVGLRVTNFEAIPLFHILSSIPCDVDRNVSEVVTDDGGRK